MKLDCYVTGGIACEIVPAPQDRAWMDASPERYPYRCLPLNIANAFGWHILTPCPLDIEYTGGPEGEDIRVTSSDPVPGFEHLALSHFKRGILTFHPGYLFRTDPGWQLLASGPFNWPKDGIAPLAGIIETDWLPFPFTMNWQLTRPGRVRFEKGEPFCQIVPVPAGGLDEAVPQIRTLESDPELKAEFEAYRDRRSDFLKRLAEGDAEARRESWQKFYFRGKLPTGTRAPASHVSKLRLPDPVDRRAPPPVAAPAVAATPVADTPAAATPAAGMAGAKRPIPLPGLSRRPVPISRQRHEGIAVAAPDYRFAQDTQLLPLGKTEVERASLDFPIVFALDPPVMAAVAGGRPGENLFVRDGTWVAGAYLPAIVRQYPFTIQLDGPQRTPVLCIDEACPWLDRTSPRKLLADGQLTQLGKSGAAIAEALLRETAAVAEFVEALSARGLLVPAGVNQDHPITERPSFARLLVVDHVRYGALPAAVAEDWRRRGWSALVAAHVRSLGNWRRLAEREEEARRSAAVASKEDA